MIFWIFLGIIFIISFLWALFNLQSELTKPKHLKTIHGDKKSTIEKHKLAKEKVLFEK